MHPGRIQGYGTGDHDPDLCMDTEGYDRLTWCSGIRRKAMRSVAGGIEVILPAIIFLVGCGLAFATGTSWGTFGILIPIVVAVFEKSVLR